MDAEFFMSRALELAKISRDMGEVPVGCVITKNGIIIGEGSNMRNASKNAVSHAEIIAISRACETIGDWRLEGADLFVTIEPCAMCAGAIINARISRVFFGARNKKFGCAGSVLNVLKEPRFNHMSEVFEGVLEEDCKKIMREFFRG
jgi:tRNA(adenine34) deaminase